MGFWFQGKKGSEAQDFGKSTKKARKSRLSFMLEEIITPSTLIPSVQDTDPLRHFLGSLPLSDWNLGHLISLVGRVWVHLLQDVGNSLHFMADAGGTCPTTPTPTGDLPSLIDPDLLGLRHDGIPTQVPGTPGGAWETPPPFMMPLDPPGNGQVNKNQLIAINPKLLDFPLADQPIVGAIDTGVSADNPYIANTNLKKGHDYVDGDDNPLLQPGQGSEHGTFIVGILNSINKNAPKWVARAIGSGKWADSLIDFVNDANLSGQKNAIINLSLDLTQKNPDGSVTTRYEFTPFERAALEYARQHGVMIVVAAGNDGDVMSVLGQASQEFDNIITVGSGNINGRNFESSYGRGLDIMADGGTTENPVLSTVGSGLGTMAGTSVATAKVTGAASLVWAANPDLSYRQVIEILEKTARDLGTPGWDDETGFGLLNTLAAVQLAKSTTPEVYNPTPWYAPDTWSGEGKVTPEERAAQGGNSIATATVQVSTTFSDSDRLDSTQPEKYYQFTVNEPGYVRWNFTSLNPVSGAGRPDVTIIKADGSSASHRFQKGASTKMFVVRQGQTSFSDGDFYDPGTYYLKVGNSAFKDYNISTQFTADGVSSFAGNIQYRTQPYKSLDDSSPTAIFSGPTVSELNNLSGQVTYNEIDYNTRIAKYGFEVNESGKFRINLNSPNGKMELNIYKFIGSEDKPVQISGLGGVSANSDQWLEVDLNKGRYEIEVKTPNDNWLEPDWNSTQKTLVRPYTLNATFTPNAPQPGQGKVPSSAGVFDKTVVSNGVVTHYYANGYLTVQPSGQASWYGYPFGVVSTSVQRINEPVPLTDPDGNYSIQTAQNLFTGSGGADLGNGVNTDQVEIGFVVSSIGGKDLSDFYKFSLNSSKLVNLKLSQLSNGAKLELIQDVNGNGQIDLGEVINTGGTSGSPLSLDRILGAGNYYLRVSPVSSGATTQYVVNAEARFPENQVIAGYNSDYYLVKNGKLRPIPNQETLQQILQDLGTNPNTVKQFPPEDLARITLDANPIPSRKDGDVFSDLAGNVYLMQSGKRHFIPDIDTLRAIGINVTGWQQFPESDINDIKLGDPISPPIPQWQKDIDNAYQSAKNLLGNPTGGYWQAADSPMGTKGYGQNYDHGSVYWTAQSGAIALWYGFVDTYNQTGGSNGWLGFPTKGKETDSSGGQRIDFEGGYIYWTEKEGAKAYHPWETPPQNLNNTVGYDGANTHPTYVNTFTRNGGSPALGSPTGNVHRSVDNGYVQEFSGGSEGSGAIMKSGANDNSYWVGGSFWDQYLKRGGVTALGYPISDRYESNGGWKQDFKVGSLSTAPSAGGGSGNGQQIIDAVNAVNPDQYHYQKRSFTPGGKVYTFCNWFAADVLDYLGVPIPRDSSQPPLYPPVFGGASGRDKPLLAEDLYAFFKNGGGELNGKDWGKWQEVTAYEAVDKANKGQAVVASSDGQPLHSEGHIAIVLPGDPNSPVHIAQAGAQNGKDLLADNIFDGINLSYFAYVGDTNSSGGNNNGGGSVVPSQELEKKLLGITGSFEGNHGFQNLAGNGDGQGISFGALQWNFGQNTLAPLLKKMYERDSTKFQEIFGNDTDNFLMILNSSELEQIAFANSINDTTQQTWLPERIKNPWRNYFMLLGDYSPFQEVQVEFAQQILNTAKNYARDYKLKTERGLSLMFDIAVQNGSILPQAQTIITNNRTAKEEALGRSLTERELLEIIAVAVAQTSNYYQDVLSRKMTIAKGSGTVHGKLWNVDQEFGLSDQGWE